MNSKLNKRKRRSGFFRRALLIATACIQIGYVSAQCTKNTSSTIAYNDGMTHTWDGSNAPPSNPILQDVVLTNNSHLVIDGITVSFAPGVSIKVDGSTAANDAPWLEVKGSAILQPCGANWTGIKVVGTVNGSGAYTDYAVASGVWSIASNAKVTINHSTVKQAAIGVEVTQLGILQISNGSNFIDNLTGVKIDEWNFTDPNVGTARNYFANMTGTVPTCQSASFIQECTFDFHSVWTGRSDFNDQYHVDLNCVKYLELAGNTYTCTYPLPLDAFNTRGWGIRGINSSFLLHESGTASISNKCRTFSGGMKNTFTALAYGINTDATAVGTTTNDPNYTVGIINTDFNQCISPIVMQDGNHPVISGCGLTTTSAGSTPYFNSTINSTFLYFMSYSLAQNMFINHNTFSSDFVNTNFIRISGSGAAQSSVYKNIMTYSGATITPGLTEYGVYYGGHNNGAQIRCNAFTGNKYDIYIDGPFNPDIGTTSDDALNTFSASGPNYVNLTNNTAYPLTYHSISNQPSTHGGPYTPDITNPFNETCPNLTDCSVWMLAINQVEEPDYHIVLYPNPARDVLHIKYDMPQPLSRLTMEILDMQGRAISSTMLDNLGNQAEINTSSLPTGFYLYRIMDRGNPVKMGKFVITK